MRVLVQWAAMIAAVAAGFQLAPGGPTTTSVRAHTGQTTTGASSGVASSDEVKARCGICHPAPPPDILPRARWRDEMLRMMLIQEGVPEPSDGVAFIPLPPELIRIQRYYEANAPERLPDPEPWPAVNTAPLEFSRHQLATPTPQIAPAIANVRFLDLDGDGQLDVIGSDMRSGSIYAGLAREHFALKAIAHLSHPAHIEQVDLDKDGLKDLLVADLG
jgi:hypothetical protein